MSYDQGTNLSYANGAEAAIVITDGYVMTKMMDGSKRRSRMKLVDWLILAEGQPITARGAAVTSSAANTVTEPVAAPVAVPLAARIAALPEETCNFTHPVSTVFKARGFNDKMYGEVTAVQTRHGILQVKAVTHEGTSLERKFFPNYTAWAKTMPWYYKFSLND